MKKFLSALMSVAVLAMPMTSNEEEPTLPYENTLPCRVSDSGDTVIFDGDKNYDYIISTNSKFTTERIDNSTEFKPEQDGKFIVSRVWIKEPSISFTFSSVIQNFEITYYSNKGTTVEFLGERTFTDMNPEDILDYSGYYAFASSRLLNDIGAFFTYYDCSWNDEKDKSVFCIDSGYYENEKGYIPVSVSGNAEITKTLYDGSYMDGNLEIATCDIVPYTLIEPTADGFAEINSFIVSPMSATIFTIENGQFLTERNSPGCDTPDNGDINIDGHINIADAVLLQKYILGKSNLTSMQYQCADMNFDGIVDIFDMVLIRKELIL